MNGRERKRKSMVRLGVVVATILIAAARAGAAGEASAGTAPERRWEFEIQTPVWIPGNYGTLTSRGRTADIDVSPGDVIDLLTSGNAFAGEGYFEFRYDRFFTYADALGGYVEEEVSATVPTDRFPRLSGLDIDAKLKLKQVLADFGVGYRLGQWTLPNRRRPVTLGVYAGARYYWFETRLRAAASIRARFPRRTIEIQRAVDVTQTFDWADPLIGLRWEVPVLDRVSLDFRGDIGGFGAGSDLAWNLIGGFRYWVPLRPFSTQPTLGAGYRALAFDRSVGSSGELDLQFRGPYVSVGVVF